MTTVTTTERSLQDDNLPPLSHGTEDGPVQRTKTSLSPLGLYVQQLSCILAAQSDVEFLPDTVSLTGVMKRGKSKDSIFLYPLAIGVKLINI